MLDACSAVRRRVWGDLRGLRPSPTCDSKSEGVEQPFHPTNKRGLRIGGAAMRIKMKMKMKIKMKACGNQNENADQNKVFFILIVGKPVFDLFS